MTKHTPGPWKLVGLGGWPEEHEGAAYSEIVGADGSPVYEGPMSFNSLKGAANARLIAAAPDLLDALETFAEVWDQYGEPSNVAVNAEWLRAVAAIKKAKGE